MLSEFFGWLTRFDAPGKRIGFVLLCVGINVLGGWVAQTCQLPLWLDAFGTILGGYVLGPLFGGAIGGCANWFHGISDPETLPYAVTSMATGVIVGLAGRRRYFDDFFHCMIIATVTCMVAILVSLPLNLFLYGGYSGNVWGDGVVNFFLMSGASLPVACLAGEFYLDFMDKTISILGLYLLIRIYRSNRGEREGQPIRAIMVVAGLLLLVMVFFSLMVDAKEPEGNKNYSTMIQTVYDNNNGLPCGKANDIVQTPDGLLWIGTYAGLYRYNGTEFQWMKDFESVKNVNCLYVDREGRLLIGTNDNGLSLCQKQSVQQVLDVEAGLPSSTVRSIVQDADGNYYVGTAAQLAVVSMEDGLKLQGVLHDIKGAVSMAADRKGHVAVVTGAGDLFLVEDERVQQRISLPKVMGQFTACFFDEAGRLYAGTSGSQLQVFQVQEDRLVQTKAITCPGQKNTNCIAQHDGVIFICTDNGIGYLDASENFHGINTRRFNNSIDSMLVDYQGNLWFASSRLGLLRFTQSSFTNISFIAGLPEKVVNAIDSWQGRLYIGTDSGLQVVDEEQQVQVEDSLVGFLGDDRIRCIRHDRQNNLWLCTYNKGLVRQSPSGELKVYDTAHGFISNRIRNILELSDGRMVVGTNKGIAFVQDGETQLTLGSKEGLGNVSVLSLLELPDGTLLVGTDGNGIVCVKDGAVTGHLDKGSGLNSEIILRMVADKAGRGTFIVTGSGICYLEENSALRKLDNIPFYNNYDLFISQADKLFLTGSAGIYVLDRAKLLAGEPQDYELLDGVYGMVGSLTANAWNYLDEEENLYVAGDTCVMSINLKQYANLPQLFRMVMSRMKLDNKLYKVPQDGQLEIARDVSRIELFPEILNYTAQNPFISYYLEGVDKEPVVIRQDELSSVLYTNVPAGEYKFHLNVLGPDKETILASTAFSLNKAKAIYDYVWFKLYLLLVPMLAVAWITWFVVRTQLQRTMSLQRRELALAQRQVQMAKESIQAIARTVDAKDENTSQHCNRVAEISLLIGQQLGFSKEDCDNLYQAAIVHDIGKIGIADAILNKASRLTDEEYAIMKTHVVRGAKILQDFTLVDHIIEGVRYHHERYDGKGYVEGLKGEEIPLFARIISVADAFDAMRASRVYRQGMDREYVINEMIKGKDKQFDGRLVDILLSLIEAGKVRVDDSASKL